MTPNPAKTSSHKTVEDRLQFLEQVEHDHSRLLTLKAKADSEMYDELKSMRNDMQEMQGKIGYCLQCLESDSDTDEEDESEEEDDEPDEEATEIEDVPGSGKTQVTPVPPEIRSLPWMERMKALGYLKESEPEQS